MTTEWAITFGVQYPELPHARFSRAHCDGYVVIEAPTEDAARRLATSRLGREWSHIYPYRSGSAYDLPESRFPLGEIERWVA